MTALVRMGLRLAAIELLRADAPFTAMVGDRVFDSEMAEIQPGEAPMPIALVHTERTQGRAYDPHSGGPPFDLECDLTIELAHVASAKNDDGSIELFRPVTTAEMEAGLDLMESRLAVVLAHGESALALGLRKHALKRVVSIESQRFETDDAGVKIASRLVTLTCDLHIEQPRVWYGTTPTGAGGAQAPAAGSDALPSGPFASLPSPLRELAELMPEGGYGRGVLLQVAAILPSPVLGPAFTAATYEQDFGDDGNA